MSTIKLSSLVRNLILVLTFFLCGCVSIPQQKFDAANNAGIKKIALLQVPLPADYSVSYDAGGAGFAAGFLGGLVGGIIVASIVSADISSKSSTFTQKVKAKNLSLSAEMAHALERELRANHYDVVYLSDQKPELRDGEDGQVLDFSKIQTDADAILAVIVPLIGYRAVPSTSEEPSGEQYVPWIRTHARLVARKNNTPLYIQLINYGPQLGKRDEIHYIPANPKYAFSSYDELLEKTDEAIQGLRKGIGPIAAKIASDLR